VCVCARGHACMCVHACMSMHAKRENEREAREYMNGARSECAAARTERVAWSKYKRKKGADSQTDS
jgi:hypothetical protein